MIIMGGGAISNIFALLLRGNVAPVIPHHSLTRLQPRLRTELCADAIDKIANWYVS